MLLTSKLLHLCNHIIQTMKTQTIQDLYNKQVKADRRAAAIERQSNDYRPELNRLYQK